MAQSGLSFDDFDRVMELSVAAWRSAADRDWSVPAGTLVWNCWQTANHLVDVVYSYAFQLAARPEGGVLPFKELEAAPSASPSNLTDGLEGMGRIMSAVLRQTPPDVEVAWYGESRHLNTWAAATANEVLLHVHDVASGVGIEFRPPEDIARDVLGHAHPDTEPGDDAWATLVRASGRPFGDAELAAWREAAAERRSRPAPVGSEDGLVSDFEDGATSTRFGTGWRLTSDARSGGSSTVDMTVVDDGADGTARSLLVTGEIVEGGSPFNWAGVLFGPADQPREPANLPGRSAVSFWAKGDPKLFALWANTSTAGGLAGRGLFTTSEQWKRFRFTLVELGTDGSDLTGLLFTADSPGPFRLQLDEVRFE